MTVFSTTLAADQGAGELLLSADDALPVDGDVLVKVDDELELVELRGGQTARPWQVRRGMYGTTDADHDEGATVTLVYPAIVSDTPAGPADNVAAIADPATAETEDVANTVNDVLAALKAAGLMVADA